MAVRRPYLSKSRLIAAWQCPKRLYLEKHHPELADITSQIEAQWATGHRVGDVARQIYATPDAVDIGFDRRTGLLERRTRELLDAGADFPIFEATFRHENVLVRVDVLLPVNGRWRAIEVKASTLVKDYHLLDCAIQDWVMRGSGFEVDSFALAHVDNRFVYPGGFRYDGLLVEHDLTGEIRALEPSVLELVVKAREAVAGPEPVISVGTHCSKPYDCTFMRHCWPQDAEYPLAGLGGGKAKLAEYVALGCRDIRDVDVDDITAETQKRIHRVTVSGEAEILDGARRAFEALPYPRYFLDFETIAPAVPFWPGTRPYVALPVQWSCHVDDGSGDGSAAQMRHREFLDLSGEPPMRALAVALIDCLGDTGPVLMYSDYEKQVIGHLIELLPDLGPELGRIVDRLYDLHPVVKQNYYHPRMLGSWSIKAVMPTLDPALDYAHLEGIREGAAASEAYLEAIAPATTPERKAELERQLRHYCRFDTEAMAAIVRYFTS